MKVFTRDYKIANKYSEKFNEYFDGMNYCILDIESTGLDPSRSKVCLTALLTRTDTGVKITQFLAENHYEEYKVLKETTDFLRRRNIDYLITFNGQAFDVPFINKRLDANFMDGHINMYDFDLYRFISKGTDLKKRISSLSQKSIEQYYGIHKDRKDTITGRENIALFDQYAVSGNTVIEKTILTHNREDVLQLHKLMLLSLNDIEDFDAAISNIGFPVMDGRFVLRPNISLTKSMLRICGDQLKSPVSASFFPDIDNPVSADFRETNSSFEVDVPFRKFGDSLFIDIKPLGIDVSSDPSYVNDFYILDSGSINRISSAILEKVVNEKLNF